MNIYALSQSIILCKVFQRYSNIYSHTSSKDFLNLNIEPTTILKNIQKLDSMFWVAPSWTRVICRKGWEKDGKLTHK